MRRVTSRAIVITEGEDGGPPLLPPGRGLRPDSGLVGVPGSSHLKEYIINIFRPNLLYKFKKLTRNSDTTLKGLTSTEGAAGGDVTADVDFGQAVEFVVNVKVLDAAL